MHFAAPTLGRKAAVLVLQATTHSWPWWFISVGCQRSLAGKNGLSEHRSHMAAWAGTVQVYFDIKSTFDPFVTW